MRKVRFAALFGRTPSDGDLHDEKRLEDVRERVSRIEGQMGTFATKEDVAIATLSVFKMWVVVGITVTSAIIAVVARFWLS